MPKAPQLRSIGIYNKDGLLVYTTETIEGAILYIMNVTDNTNYESLQSAISMSLSGVRESSIERMFYVRGFSGDIAGRILPPIRRNAADIKLNTECHAYMYDRDGKFLFEVFYYRELAHIFTFHTFSKIQGDIAYNGFHYSKRYYLTREDYGEQLPHDIIWRIKSFYRKSKLTVYAKNLATGEESEFRTAQHAAEVLGIGKSHISECLNAKRGRTHCHGYSFAYKKTGLLQL